MKRTNILLLALLVVLLAAGLVPLLAPAAAVAAGPVVSADAKWNTYLDPRFGFALEVPASWKVLPRDDSPGAVGGVVAFVDSSPEMKGAADLHTGPRRLEVGFYPTEIEPWMDLADWVERYDAAAPGAELVLATETSALVIDDGGVRGFDATRPEAVYTVGTSELGEFAYVALARDRMVWFVWTNRNDAGSLAVLSHVAGSWVFGDIAPGSLEEAYGATFRPEMAVSFDALESEPELGTEASLSDYRSPVGTIGVYCGKFTTSLCNGTHKGKDLYAMDARVTNVNFKAVVDSSHASHGYSNPGLGVWVRYTEGTRSIRYAHLTSHIVPNPSAVTRGTVIGKTGSSGGVSAHLHFSVYSGSTAVRITGSCAYSLPTSTFPNCGKTDCAGFDDLNRRECVCGNLYSC